MSAMVQDAAGTDTLPRVVAELQARLEELRRTAGTTTEEPLVAELDTAHEELKVADEEIRVQQEELDRLVNHQQAAERVHDRFLSLLPAALLVTDHAGAIRFANAAAAVMLAVRLDRLVGKPVFAFVDPTDRADLRRLLSAVCDGSQPTVRRLVTLTGRRGAVPVEVALSMTTHRYRVKPEVTWVLLGEDGAFVDRAGDALAPLAGTVLRITQLPIVTTDVAELLQKVAPLCQQAFSVPVAASVCLGMPGSPEALATDSRLAQQADGAQILVGTGPCQLAYQSQGVVASNDPAVDPRWPQLHERFEALGLGSVIAVPVRIADAVAGCLNVYSQHPSLVTDANVAAAELLAGAIAAVLHESEAKRELALVAEQMRVALQSRATIDQAKGILMAQHGYDADAAFRELVGLSNRLNTKVRDVAAALVANAAAGTSAR
jgi:PAS domain S-box-containing protein